MPNSDGPDQIQNADFKVEGGDDAARSMINEVQNSSGGDFGLRILPREEAIEPGDNYIETFPQTNENGSEAGQGGIIEIPSLTPQAEGGDLEITSGDDGGEDLGYRHPIANLAEEYMGRKPHLETGYMAGVPNPGRVAQAHFASMVIKGRGMPEIGNNSGHYLAAQLDDHPELFQKIELEGRDNSELRAGDIVFGFRQPMAGHGFSMVGIVNNKGDITWANSQKDGVIDNVSKDKFFSVGSIRKYVAYRQDLLG